MAEEISEQEVLTTEVEEQEVETADDQLLGLPAEKLVAMLRDKRKAESSVRSKLRDAESERDKLSASVTGYQRSAFGEAAKRLNLQPSAVDDALTAVDMSEVLGDDGVVDPEKVGEALVKLKQSKPHYFKGVSRVNASDAGWAGEPSSAAWGDVLR